MGSVLGADGLETLFAVRFRAEAVVRDDGVATSTIAGDIRL
jgi:hypothetical protein